MSFLKYLKDLNIITEMLRPDITVKGLANMLFKNDEAQTKQALGQLLGVDPKGGEEAIDAAIDSFIDSINQTNFGVRDNVIAQRILPWILRGVKVDNDPNPLHNIASLAKQMKYLQDTGEAEYKDLLQAFSPRADETGYGKLQAAIAALTQRKKLDDDEKLEKYKTISTTKDTIFLHPKRTADGLEEDADDGFIVFTKTKQSNIYWGGEVFRFPWKDKFYYTKSGRCSWCTARQDHEGNLFSTYRKNEQEEDDKYMLVILIAKNEGPNSIESNDGNIEIERRYQFYFARQGGAHGGVELKDHTNNEIDIYDFTVRYPKMAARLLRMMNDKTLNILDRVQTPNRGEVKLSRAWAPAEEKLQAWLENPNEETVKDLGTLQIIGSKGEKGQQDNEGLYAKYPAGSKERELLQNRVWEILRNTHIPDQYLDDRLAKWLGKYVGPEVKNDPEKLKNNPDAINSLIDLESKVKRRPNEQNPGELLDDPDGKPAYEKASKVATRILDEISKDAPSLDDFLNEIKKELNLDKFLNATFDDDGNIVFPDDAPKNEAFIPFIRQVYANKYTKNKGAF